MIEKIPGAAYADPLSPLQRRKDELGTFLRLRRSQLRPEDIGMPAIGRRHVKGLRREEIASAAGISASWYTLLEQGRADVVTPRTLNAIADVLSLSRFEREHVLALGRADEEDAALSRVPPPAGLVRFVDSYPLAPAHMHTTRFDLVAWNALTNGYLFVDEHGPAPNLLRIMVEDPRVRESWVDPDWTTVLRIMVGHFRLFYARFGGPDFDALVAELSGKCETFDRCWKERSVPNMMAKPTVLRHRELGTVAFNALGFTAHESPSYFIVLHSPTALPT